jgi:hypothetical protein
VVLFPRARTAPPGDGCLRRLPVENIPATAAGRVDLEALKSRSGPMSRA